MGEHDTGDQPFTGMPTAEDYRALAGQLLRIADRLDVLTTSRVALYDRFNIALHAAVQLSDMAVPQAAFLQRVIAEHVDVTRALLGPADARQVPYLKALLAEAGTLVASSAYIRDTFQRTRALSKDEPAGAKPRTRPKPQALPPKKTKQKPAAGDGEDES
jgi:hypothetical protein